MANIKFNWSMLDRYNIATFVWLLESEIVNKTISISKFHSLITNHIKRHFPIICKKTLDIKNPKGYVSIGGTYYSGYDEEKQKCIELVFVYKDTDTELKISKKRFWNLCLLIADSVLHEIIHMRQYRKRKFKVIPDYNSTAAKTSIRKEQSYLGCADEIDAYGFNIACELYEKFNGNQESIILYLNENQKNNNRKKYNSWRMYLKAFQHDHNHKIIKRLKKKVVKYIPAAKRGKPFRTKDWIDR
jgi:hypothetical protein